MFRSLIFILSVITLISPAMGQSNPYESTIRGFEQADLLNPPPTNSILVLGSSTIVGWHTMEAAFPRFNVLNRGFGGSQTSDVLYFYDRILPVVSGSTSFTVTVSNSLLAAFRSAKVSLAPVTVKRASRLSPTPMREA